MRSKALTLGALIFVLLILGLATLNGAVIALALPLAVYLVTASLYRPTEVQLRANRSLSATNVAPGQNVVVTLTLVNDGMEACELHVQDVVCPGLEVISGDTDVIAPIPARGQLVLEYSVRGNRGEFGFRAVTITHRDWSGLFQRQAVLAAPATLLVRPHVRKLRPITLRPPRTRGFAGPIPARQSGSGIDFFGLRQYQMGDRLRWMNWRVSARHERSLFTNEFEQERIADVGIILDARRQNDVITASGSLYDHSTQAAASMAEMLLEQGNRVGLWIYGRGREGVFPGYGNVQRERIYRALGRTASGHNYALESLSHLPTRFFPAGSQIVFIGSLTGADDVMVLTRLRANGYSVMAISPDPIDYEAQSLESQSLEGRGPKAVVARPPGAPEREGNLNFAYRLTQIERRLALLELQRIGAQVVDWRVRQPLDQVLHESLARRPVHHGRPVRGLSQ